MLTAILFRVREPIYLTLAEETWTRERITPSGSISIEVRWRAEGTGVIPVEALLRCWRNGQLAKIQVHPQCVLSLTSIGLHHELAEPGSV